MTTRERNMIDFLPSRHPDRNLLGNGRALAGRQDAPVAETGAGRGFL